ncbi:MAG: DNA repair protein RecO [Bacteroidales bacterium]|nr:DNA repair protein RecO [Bacteroidales bacterium]ODT56723.1 MAG: DNA repair protein RecO [Paludibacter sp. SCN 50-10]OJX90947.1 MAG: DNA repair protein RecO [Paludibacter sp. 47-17]
MQVTTKAIVLRMVKFSDKASAVTVFTRDYGRMSLIVYGVSGRKSGGKAALLQPLSLVEITIAMHPGKEMQQLKDIRTHINLPGISTHPVKNAIALFLAELLYKTLKHQQDETGLYDFLQVALEWLNESDAGIADFHLVLMCRLSRHLGFEPNCTSMELPSFDLLNGCFCPGRPLHAHYVKPGLMEVFRSLLLCNFSSMEQLQLSRQQRNELLETLLEYYRLHLPEFHSLQSTEVLHELFN